MTKKKNPWGKSTRQRSIIFDTKMIRAILKGRKTEDRRIAKESFDGQGAPARCHYGEQGDILWVKEKYSTPPDGTWDYAAKWPDDTIRSLDLNGGWKSASSMPRRFSRITLRIIDVRLQRLHDIRAKDARAEGITSPRPRLNYRKNWKPNTGPQSWDANPYVWVIKFEKLEP